MPEQNTNEQTQNLIAGVVKQIKIDTRDIFDNFGENQKKVDNSMNGVGTEEIKTKGDLGRDI